MYNFKLVELLSLHADLSPERTHRMYKLAIIAVLEGDVTQMDYCAASGNISADAERCLRKEIARVNA